MRYAVVDKENRVVNVIEWDEVSLYDPGEGLKLIRSDEADIDQILE